MGEILSALSTLGSLLKIFLEFREWIRDENNKKVLIEGIKSWEALKNAQTHEERQNAAQNIAKLISG